MARVFYESDIVELAKCKPNIDNLIHALTYGEETPADGSVGIQAVAPFKVLEEPAVTKVRVCVALGLAPIAALQVTKSELLSGVDQLALRIRERMGAGTVERSLAEIDGPNGTPLTEKYPDGILADGAGNVLNERAPLKGELPSDFPALAALVALEPPVHTYHQVRTLIATGTADKPWYKDVKGIAAPTAAKVEEAAAVSVDE